MCATFGPSMLFQAPHRHQIAGAEIPDLTGVEPGFSEGGGVGVGQTPTLSNCYCCLTSPFITRKSIVKILAFVSLRGFNGTTPGSALV